MNESEKKVVYKMIAIYCKAHHKHEKSLCEDCNNLYNYAKNKLENCKYGDNKPTCSVCPVHCYIKDMRIKIRKVMKYSGTRMGIYHPIDTIKYLLKKNKFKKIYQTIE